METELYTGFRDIMLILHFIGLVMGLGTSFAHMFLGMAGSKMPAGEATSFSIKTLALTRMGHIGLGLLIISGIFLMTPYWYLLPSTPLLIIKLVLVAILIVLVTIITIGGNKAKKSDPDLHLGKIRPLGKLTLLIGVLIVVIAVYVFH